MDSFEQMRLVNSLIKLTEEVVKLNDEIKELEKIIVSDTKAYERYKKCIGARDAIREQIRQIQELLRST